METPFGGDQPVDILAVADLIRRGAHLTATSSLRPSPAASPPSPSRPNPHSRPPPTSFASTSGPPYPNPNVLTPLARPSVLIGTVSLPAETPSCPNRSCLRFSDDSASVCCDILDFSVHVIALEEENEKKRKEIRVLSWNFIPVEERSRGSGFLEIIKWSFHNPVTTSNVFSRCSGLDSVSLNLSSSCSLDKLKARYRVHGPIESVSPVSAVSCSAGSNESQLMRGFLIRVLTCTCGVCVSRDSLVSDMAGGGARHSFTESSFVYFFGTFWRWHPLITRLLGRVIVLTGLRKKLVFIGKDESELMLVATDVSVLHLPGVGKRWVPTLRKPIKGSGESGAYSGIVRGVYMKGMVVELDNEVWLLLTDRQQSMPHSLRVGAVIFVWNVHYVLPKFSWTKVLVLGACYRTSILVHSFSPLETGSFMTSISHSQLGKFIMTLPFSARLWTTLVVSCFSRKLTGILTEKEILGSKHEEGLVQKFVRSQLTPGATLARHGLLKEFCKHESHGCGGEPCHNLRLVAPISTCLQYFEAIWMKTLFLSEKHYRPFCSDSRSSHLQCEWRQNHPPRKILPSESVGIILLGRLEISKSSGRLQLVDSTGRLDVAIPDLPSSWTTDIICEVADYNLILEDRPQLGNHPDWHEHESLSCGRLLHGNISSSAVKLTTWVHFRWKNLYCPNPSFNPCTERNDFKGLWSGRFHLVKTTHIYPVLQKYPGDQVTANSPTVFVETMVLPWDLVLVGKDETALAVVADADPSHEPSTHMPLSKKQKLDKTSRRLPISGLAVRNDGAHSTSSCYESFCNPEIACESLSASHDITCLVSISSDGTLTRSGRLCCTKCGGGGDTKCKPSIEMLLLEFVSDSIFKCQSLQAGNYYLVKHHPEEPFCCLKECDNVSKSRVHVTSKMRLWSLAFLSDVVVRNRQSSANASLDDIPSKNIGISVTECVELCGPSGYSDVYVDLPDNIIGYENVKIDEMIANLCVKRPIFEIPEVTFDHASFSLSNTSWAPGTSSLFPEGDLISMHGEVIAIYGLDCTPNNLRAENQFNELHTRLFQGLAYTLDIRVLVNNQMVTVFGSLRKHVCPVGFGPGVTAYFHRVLKPRGTDKVLLTPVSLIQVHAIEIAKEPYLDNFSTVRSTLSQSDAVSLNSVSGVAFKPFKDQKLMELNGRVVALHVLVLEWNIKYNLPSRVHPVHPSVNIPLAAFVLDDGSSSCCCWASDERAASLLRLHEKLPSSALRSSGCKMNGVGLGKLSLRNIVFHVERILKKHGRITVRNHGSLVDSLEQEFMITVSSQNPISFSDENLLKLIAFNACFGTLWTIFANTMESNTVKVLEEKNLVEPEMSVCNMQNLWAENVCHIDTLNQAKKMMQELQTNRRVFVCQGCPFDFFPGGYAYQQ